MEVDAAAKCYVVSARSAESAGFAESGSVAGAVVAGTGVGMAGVGMGMGMTGVTGFVGIASLEEDPERECVESVSVPPDFGNPPDNGSSSDMDNSLDINCLGDTALEKSLVTCLSASLCRMKDSSMRADVALALLAAYRQTLVAPRNADVMSSAVLSALFIIVNKWNSVLDYVPFRDDLEFSSRCLADKESGSECMLSPGRNSRGKTMTPGALRDLLVARASVESSRCVRQDLVTQLGVTRAYVERVTGCAEPLSRLSCAVVCAMMMVLTSTCDSGARHAIAEALQGCASALKRTRDPRLPPLRRSDILNSLLSACHVPSVYTPRSGLLAAFLGLAEPPRASTARGSRKKRIGLTAAAVPHPAPLLPCASLSASRTRKRGLVLVSVWNS